MKNTHYLTSLALASSLILTACSPSSPTTPAESPKAENPTVSPSAPKAAFSSAEKTSYAEVTSQLDPGGNFYMYLGTEQWLTGVSTNIATWRDLFIAAPTQTDSTRAALKTGFDQITTLVRNSGLEEVSGVGISGIAREKGLNRTKVFIHHYPAKNIGFGWSLLGEKPHSLDSFQMLPATTAFTSFYDVNLPLIWQTIEKTLTNSSIPNGKQSIDELKASVQKELGISFDELLGKYAGEAGVILTLDDTRKMPIPVQNEAGQNIMIPEPGLILAIRVKDQTLFNVVEKKLPTDSQIVKVDEPDLKMRTMALPLPFPLRPTIAQADGYFFFATTEKLVRDIIAAKKGEKPGLKSTSDFVRASQDIPLNGNGFTYISPKFWQTWSTIQKATIAASSRNSGSGDAEFEKRISNLFLTSDSKAVSFTVFSHLDNGWLITGNTTQAPAKVLMAPAVVISVPVLAAIAIPNFVKARTTAQKNACMANLRILDGATQQWALENKKRSTDKVNVEQISKYLKGDKIPACPAGGTYTFGRVKDQPKCSIPGHEIPH